MSANYRGPYFRTGVDGAGNYWELGTSSSVQTQRRFLARKPLNWELQKPKLFANSSQTENSGMTTWAQPVLSSDTQYPKETFITKEYLKDMLLEIWKEGGAVALPSPPNLNTLESKTSENVKPPESEAKEIAPDLEKNVSNKFEGDEAKVPEYKTVRSDNTTKSHVSELAEENVILQTPIRTFVSPRQAKRRTFEFFQKLSYDPPRTPPPVVHPSKPVETKSSLSSMTLLTQGHPQNKPVKKRSKKSRSKIPSPEPILDLNEQGQMVYPTQAQFETYMLPQQYALRPPFQILKSRINSRSTQQRREESLRSMMVVKKVPLVDGLFNDRMLPPILSTPEPLPKPTAERKKRFDAWRPLRWSQPHHQQQRDLVQEYVRQYQEATPPLQLVGVKAKAQVESPPPVVITKPKKPLHPSKQFPVHVPGPKKENMYIGPYVDSEVDLLRKDIQIKPKNE